MLPTVRNLVRPAWLALALCVCAALAAGTSEAQSPKTPPSPNPPAPRADKPQATPAQEVAPVPADRVTEIKVSPRPVSATPVPSKGSEEWESGCKPGQPAIPPAQFEDQTLQQSLEPGLGPRFVCDALVCKGEPVWQGQPALFSFAIRNEGKADLHIQAKGG